MVVDALRMDDLDDLMEIERASFSLPWPRSIYRFELTRNAQSHYLVLRPSPDLAAAARSIMRLPRLLAYGGFWLFGEEAHICTLACHPDYRRHGLGEWLLLHLLGRAESLGAEYVTLEVRVSNTVAQRLYERTGFQVTGVRPRYYSDNREDALIMTTSSLQSAEMQAILSRRRQIVADRLRAWRRELTESVSS